MLNPDAFFVWHTYDVRALLPDRWHEDLVEIACGHAQTKTAKRRSKTSREDVDVPGVPVSTVEGAVLRPLVPWLFELYGNQFRQLAQRVSGEPVVVSTRDRTALNLNLQRGSSERGKAHVDSNPLGGVLYVTSHPPGSGGELAVARNEEAVGVEEIEASSALISPVAGHLVLFDARRHPHFVRPLKDEGEIRVVATLDYYTLSCTESSCQIDSDADLFEEP